MTGRRGRGPGDAGRGRARRLGAGGIALAGLALLAMPAGAEEPSHGAAAHAPETHGAQAVAPEADTAHDAAGPINHDAAGPINHDAPATEAHPADGAAEAAPAEAEHDAAPGGETDAADATHAGGGEGHGETETHADDGGDGHGEGEAATPHWPTTRPPQPLEIVRSLEFLQDQIARGNAAAMRAQQAVLDRFAPAFLSAEPSVWDDPRNLRAAIVFTMSGGPPSVLRGVRARATIAPEDLPLVEAALAYVENQGADAARRFAPLDLDRLEPALAAQASLARAQLLETSDPAKALADINRVRLAMPGTLLEEAALRMGVPIAEASGETRLADILARRYFDAYARSAYAGNFRARFAATYAERGRSGGIEVLETIRDITHALPDPERLAILLSVARRALVMGNEPLAARIAEDAVAAGGLAPVDATRAELYAAAATLALHPAPDARARLLAVDASLLYPADLEIRAAALAVTDGMGAPVAGLDPPAEPAAPDPGPAAEVAAADAPEASAVLSRGAALLDQVSNDLRNIRQ